MSYRNIIMSFTMMAIMIFAAWTTLSYQPRATAVPNSLDHIPDTFIEDMHAIVMNKHGDIALKISAQKMIHYPNQDSSELSNPKLTIFRKSPQPWFITSRSAKTINGITQIDFFKDVTIHHAADLIDPATVIKTSQLTFYPGAQKAETAEHITLLQPNMMINATGMLADIGAGNIKLLSETQGEYIPDA